MPKQAENECPTSGLTIKQPPYTKYKIQNNRPKTLKVQNKTNKQKT